MSRRRRVATWSAILLGALASACTSNNSAPAVSELDAQAELVTDAGSATDLHDAQTPELAIDASLDAAAADAPITAAADANITPTLCETHYPTECPTPPTRYQDVKPIFERRCVVCHSPLWTGPWPLDELQHVADWQDDIRTDMLNCSMPLPEAGIPITLEERQQILSFLRCGLPI